MKRGNTKNTKKKIAPIIAACLVILYVLPMMAMGLRLMGLPDFADGVRIMFPLLCWLIVGGAVIVGVLRALCQRLREIDRGEEEDAQQY